MNVICGDSMKFLCKLFGHKDMFIPDKDNSIAHPKTGHYFCNRCKKITGGVGSVNYMGIAIQGQDGEGKAGGKGGNATVCGSGIAIGGRGGDGVGAGGGGSGGHATVGLTAPFNPTGQYTEVKNRCMTCYGSGLVILTATTQTATASKIIPCVNCDGKGIKK